MHPRRGPGAASLQKLVALGKLQCYGLKGPSASEVIVSTYSYYSRCTS